MTATIKQRKKRTPEQRTAITPAELAKLWGRDPSTVLGWVHRGELTAFNTAEPGKRPRFLIEWTAIEAFKLARSVVPPPTSTRGRRAHVARQAAVTKFF